MSKRRQKQKDVAESRAPVFARPAQPSSTPTGLVSSNNSKESSWPGPFATALEIIARREDAKRRRIEAIQNQQDMNETTARSRNELKDEYDIMLSNLVWKPSKTGFSSFKPKSLNDLCIEAFANSSNELNSHIINSLPEDSRIKLLIQLAKLRLITSQIALMFAIRDSSVLNIPECSLVDEETILRAINTVGSSTDTDDDTSPISIRMIQLHNAGLGFGDKSALHIASRIESSQHSLEVLEVTGLYRLSDKALSQLLVACQNSLKYLDISSNARFSVLSMQSLRLDNLLSLCLDNITHLTDEHLELIFMKTTTVSTIISSPSSSSSSSSSSTKVTGQQRVSSLESLSLAGLLHVTDKGITSVLERVGSSLQSFRLAYCSLLTDNTLIAIRTLCHSLRHIDISYIPSLTTTALIGLFVLHPSLLVRQNDGLMMSEDDDGEGDDDDDSVEVVTTADYKLNQQGVLNMDEQISEMMDKSHLAIGRLESVSLQGLSNVTDDVIVHLALCSKNTLQSLNISGCHQVTSKSMMVLSMHCASCLHSLDVSFVRRVHEDALGYLLDKIVSTTAASSLSSAADGDGSAPGAMLHVGVSPNSIAVELSVWSCTQLSKRFYSGINSQIVHVIGKQTWL